jgi:phytoene synthase
MRYSGDSMAQVIRNTADFDWCEALTRKRGSSFHRAMILLPRSQRRSIFALYAWMRAVDDLIDDRAVQADDALDRFADWTATLFEGRVPVDEPMWRAMRVVLDQCTLPRAPFDAMLKGQRLDLAARPVCTLMELEAYCQHVGSSVGCLCMHVWGCTSRAGFEQARRLGIAFQLTNMLRDVGEDLGRGRCYLPLSDDVTRDMLIAWHPPEACSGWLVRWTDLAESHYAAAHGLEQFIEPDCRPTLSAMTAVYYGMLKQLARTPKRSVLGPRAGLSSLRTLGIVARAQLTAR